MALSLQEGLSACCKTIVHNLVAMNAPNQYSQLGNKSALNALNSPKNLQGVDPELMNQVKASWGKNAINGGGAGCKLKVWVTKPNCGSSTAKKSICNNSNTVTPSDLRLEYDLTIEKSRGSEGRIRPIDYNCLCDGGQAETIQREIIRAAENILAYVNNEAVTSIEALMGNYTNGNSSLTNPATLNLFTTANGNFQLQPQGWMPLLLQYQKMQSQGGVIALGGDLAFQYNAMPNLSRGITGEYLLPNDISLWYDTNVQALSDNDNANPLLTWAPGAISLMRYMDNWNSAENHISQPGTVSRAIVPLFGHDFDLTIVADGSCDIIRWVLNYEWDLFALPAAAWGSCAEGTTNMRQAYAIGCGPYECDQLPAVA
jgi:hypothetical protein